MAVPFLLALMMRLSLIGGPPFTDEGVYAGAAYVGQHFGRPPANLPIALYPRLCSLTGLSSRVPYLQLRLTDALWASVAAGTVGLFLLRWVPVRVAVVFASLWVLAAGHPRFVDAGFKNAIWAALIPYLAALRIACGRGKWSPFAVVFRARGWRGRLRVVHAVCLLAMVGLARPSFQYLCLAWQQSRSYAPVMVLGRDDVAIKERSLYLSVARTVNQATRPDDRVVVSGFYLGLFPLSDRLPPSPDMMDLTFMEMTGRLSRDSDSVRRLRETPPAVVVETLRFPVPLRSFWTDFDGLYELIREFPTTEARHYGFFGARVWRLRGLSGRNGNEVHDGPPGSSA